MLGDVTGPLGPPHGPATMHASRGAVAGGLAAAVTASRRRTRVVRRRRLFQSLNSNSPRVPLCRGVLEIRNSRILQLLEFRVFHHAQEFPGVGHGPLPPGQATPAPNKRLSHPRPAHLSAPPSVNPRLP